MGIVSDTEKYDVNFNPQITKNIQTKIGTSLEVQKGFLVVNVSLVIAVPKSTHLCYFVLSPIIKINTFVLKMVLRDNSFIHANLMFLSYLSKTTSVYRLLCLSITNKSYIDTAISRIFLISFILSLFPNRTKAVSNFN